MADSPHKVSRDLKQSIKAIARNILPKVIQWNADFRRSSGRGTQPWKQTLKNKFVHETQLATNEPHKQKKKWKKDLQKAVDETIAETCPNWKTEKADLKLYNKIRKVTERRSPRQDWLQEKAYAWLKSPHGREMLRRYPGYEIQIAHEIFLRGAGELCSFIKYLRKRKQSTYLKQLIATTTGLR